MLIWITSFLISFAQAQVSSPTYCNGRPITVAGESLYANGTRMKMGTTVLYPNGKAVEQAGDTVYPNGQRIEISGDEYYMSGQRVVAGGDVFYPNGKRVQIASECYYPSGTKMATCPSRIIFEDEDQGIRMKGVLDLKEPKIVERTFELREPTLVTTWQLSPDFHITNIKTNCL